MTRRAKVKAVHRAQRERKRKRKGFHMKDTTTLFVDPTSNLKGSVAALAAIAAATKKG